jgi:hypothetical protein
MKVSKKLQNQIRKEHKEGAMQGMLSWKYDIDLFTIVKITNPKSLK